jgi:hypothetical protein
MSLIITFMFEPAKLQMNCASASGAKNLRRASAGLMDAALSVTSPTLDLHRARAKHPRFAAAAPASTGSRGSGRDSRCGAHVGAEVVAGEIGHRRTR